MCVWLKEVYKIVFTSKSMKTIFSILVFGLVIQTCVSLRLIESGPRPADCYGSFTDAETFCEFYGGQSAESVGNVIFHLYYSNIVDENVPQGCILTLQDQFDGYIPYMVLNSNSNNITCSTDAYCVCADSNVTQADVDAAVASSSCEELKTTYNQKSCCPENV